MSLLLNLVLPALLLIWGGELLGLEPWWVLVLALLGPVGMGTWELVVARKVNHVSVLGTVSVLLTGGIGLLELDAGWIAFKEAAVPLVLGLILLVSAFTPWPVLKILLLDAELLDVERIESRVAERGAAADFTRLIRAGTYLFAASFALSAGLGYGLAVALVHSPSGTQAFNEELGRMTAWSFPVVALPSMVISVAALWWLLGGLRRITGLSLDELFGNPAPDPPDASVE